MFAQKMPGSRDRDQEAPVLPAPALSLQEPTLPGTLESRTNVATVWPEGTSGS